MSKYRPALRTMAATLTAALIVAPWLSGCGGGGSSVIPTGATQDAGSLAVSVTFPSRQTTAPPANLPPETDRVVVAVSGIGLAEPLTKELARQGDGQVTATATFSEVPVGEKQVLATAHTSANDTVLAGAFNGLNVTAGQANSVELVMGPPAYVATQTVVGTKDIDGATIAVLQSSADGGESYFSTGAAGVLWHGELQKEFAQRAFLTAVEQIARPPLVVAPAGPPGTTSQQTINLHRDGLLTETVAATTTFIGMEGIAIPAGKFTAAKVRLEQESRMIGSGDINTEVSTLWLVPGLGMVAMATRETGTVAGGDPGGRLPRLTVLTDSTLLSTLAASPVRQTTTGLLSPAVFPLEQGASWTYVELLKRETGDADVTVSKDSVPE